MAPGDVRFSSALLVAGVLKAIAVLTFIGGIFATGAAAAEANNSLGDSEWVVTIVTAGIAASLTTAGLFAFGAYVMEILVGIYDEMLELRLSLVDDRDQESDDDKWTQIPPT